MSNNLTIFSNPEFGEIRTIVVDGEPWFVGNDVAKACGYSQPDKAVKTNVSDEDTTLMGVSDANHHTQQMNVINESGMYSLVLGCRLESAKRFKHWVTSEVLPSIRKTGYYSVSEQKVDSYTIADPIERAKRWIEEQEEKKALESKVTELEPKGQYFDQLVDNKLLTTFRDTAKEFNIAPQKFTKWLLDNKYVYKDKRNMIKPYEIHRKAGLFKMKDFNTSYGYSGVQTYITVKGNIQIAFARSGQEIKMRIYGKEIKDECSQCGKILECELFRQGHGIGCERTNISEMVKCQLEHYQRDIAKR